MVTVYAKHGKPICIGREGENNALQVVFDLSFWQRTYGPGTAQLIVQRPGDPAPYPVALDVDGDRAFWTITSADTAKAEFGKAELRYMVNDTLAKSEAWTIIVLDALGEPSENTPEAYQAWVDKVLEAAQRAESAAVNTPKIGANGNWYVWNFDVGAYVDTGVVASGGGSGAVSSVNGKTGAVTLQAADVGAVPVPATAEVGQTIVVKAVDEAGKPTEWEAADMPSGGGSSLPTTGVEDAGKVLTVMDTGVPGWAYAKVADELKSDLAKKDSADDDMELIASVELTEDVSVITVDKDADGNPFNLRSILVTGSVVGGADVTSNSEFIIQSYPEGYTFNAATIATLPNSLRTTPQNFSTYFRLRCIKYGTKYSFFRENLSCLSIGIVNLGAQRYGLSNNVNKGCITNFRLSTQLSFGAGTKFDIWGVRL